ncbi:hypothetical protein BSK56_00945 [Paenibacillus borealis]|uniref:Uncharacterized protein n=1 Tax=Paenibacillus borealis TaxID=160799 RepID=A0ABX3HU49_PAEBO|nr:hypothetical protein BSK56_00945 [Paenibacillus borealis]
MYIQYTMDQLCLPMDLKKTIPLKVYKETLESGYEVRQPMTKNKEQRLSSNGRSAALLFFTVIFNHRTVPFAGNSTYGTAPKTYKFSRVKGWVQNQPLRVEGPPNW